MIDTPRNHAGARAATPATRLLLDARPSAIGGVDPARRLLGLSLLRRMVLAARRAGFGEVIVLAAQDDADRFAALVAGLPDVTVITAPPADDPVPAPTAHVPARLLGEREWLARLAGTPVADDACRAATGGIRLCGAAMPLARVVEATPIAESEPALTLAPLPMVFDGEADLAPAERRLLRALVKETDGFMARHVERPMSIALSRHLAGTAITPNQMTILSVLVGLVGAPFFLVSAPFWQTAGALLFLAHSILDGCDGELARLKFQESRWGGVLDFWGDNVVHATIFACMAVGWSLAAGAVWPLVLGVAATGGTLASASFVYWHTMRDKGKEGPLYTTVSRGPSAGLGRLLDALSRRDFIYLVLLLSLFGKADWFLAVTAIGAPVFFVMLLVVAAREGATADRHSS